MASKTEPKLPVVQLAVLSLCRLAEPIAMSSVSPYLPEMIESFGVEQHDVAYWAGIIFASFSVVQAMTGIPWGTASDVFGRKPALLAGLAMTMAATVLFGFAQSLTWAIVARGLAGGSSGTIGIARTAVAEMVPWKELQPRAFSFMPIVWSVGTIVGPVIGGALAMPATKYPDVFGSVDFFRQFPFSLPNLLAAAVFLFGVALCTLFFEETLAAKQDRFDWGRAVGRALVRPFQRQTRTKSIHDDEETPLLSGAPAPSSNSSEPARVRDVLTRQTVLSLSVYTLIALHSIAFDTLLPVFLHLKPQDLRERHLPLKFAGGFDLDSGQISTLLFGYAILGVTLQFCVFPPIARRYGVLACLRLTTMLAPIPSLLIPFTVLFPTSATQRIAAFAVMAIKCVLGAFWFPCSIIALTNSVPSPRLLGTLNGLATSISAIGRALGPASAGAIFTFGAKRGYVVLPWFYIAAFAALNYLVARLLVDMDGLNTAKHRPQQTPSRDTEDLDQSVLASGGPRTTRHPGTIVK